jgi:hypothetical protein
MSFNFERVLWGLLAVLFLGTVSVFAGNVFVNEDGIRASYSSSSGANGVEGNFTLVDSGGNEVELIFEDGLLVGVGEVVNGDDANFTSISNHPTLADGLVAYYNFEGPIGGSLLEDLAGNHDGVIHELGFSEDGVVGKAGYFDGIDNYVDLPGLEEVLNEQEGTLSLWIRPERLEQWAFPFEHYSDSQDRVFFNIIYGEMNFAYMDKHVSIPVFDYNSGWVHLVATWEFGNVNIYFDGEPSTTSSGHTVRPFTSKNGYHFGKAWTNDRYFDGLVDEAGIWDRALSSEEVADLNNGEEGLSF